jgi:transposase
VDGQRVVSGILHVVRNGLRWRDAPADYGGTALMLPSLPQAREMLGDKGYDRNRFRQAPAASCPAFPPAKVAGNPSRTTTRFTARGIASKTYSAASKGGGASPRV